MLGSACYFKVFQGIILGSTVYSNSTLLVSEHNSNKSCEDQFPAAAKSKDFSKICISQLLFKRYTVGRFYGKHNRKHKLIFSVSASVLPSVSLYKCAIALNVVGIFEGIVISFQERDKRLSRAGVFIFLLLLLSGPGPGVELSLLGSYSPLPFSHRSWGKNKRNEATPIAFFFHKQSTLN